MKNSNRSMIFSLVFIAIIWLLIAYSCQSQPSLGDIRGAREMMRKDMEVIRQVGEVAEFDDDRKTKIGSAMLAVTISPKSWSQDRISQYRAVLASLDWIESRVVDQDIFFCKRGASALIINYRGTDKNGGYIYMMYPSDPRSSCGKQ